MPTKTKTSKRSTPKKAISKPATSATTRAKKAPAAATKSRTRVTKVKSSETYRKMLSSGMNPAQAEAFAKNVEKRRASSKKMPKVTNSTQGKRSRKK